MSTVRLRMAVRCDGCGQVVADESLRGVWFQPGEDVASWARSYARALGWLTVPDRDRDWCPDCVEAGDSW